MPELTTVAGCAIEHDLIYLAQMTDEVGFDAEVSRMSFYDPQNVGAAWLAHDLRWKTVSVCVWKNSPWAKRVYVALSNEGDVEMIGPSQKPEIVEHIPGAGLNRPWSLQKGPMMRIRQIGSCLYACGSGFLVFKRDQHGWGDTHKSAADSMFFYDINGHDENSIYAAGPNGFSTSKITHFNGSEWIDLITNSPGSLTSIRPSSSGGVYIGGSNGVLVYGDDTTHFYYAAKSKMNLYIIDLAELDGCLYIAATSGLFQLTKVGREIEPVITGLEPEMTDVSRLDTVDGVLWVFGSKDLAFFNGSTWTRVHDPENPRLGR